MKKIDMFLLSLFLLLWGECEGLPEESAGASHCGRKILS